MSKYSSEFKLEVVNYYLSKIIISQKTLVYKIENILY